MVPPDIFLLNNSNNNNELFIINLATVPGRRISNSSSLPSPNVVRHLIEHLLKNHAITMRPFLFLLMVLTSCTVPDKASLKVIRETRKLRKSPVILKAYKLGTVTEDQLELRENNSFSYSSRILGRQKCVNYAGTFTKNEDTLFLSFHNNHKDSLWTGKVTIDTIKKEITLISKNAYSNKRMTITKRN